MTASSSGNESPPRLKAGAHNGVVTVKSTADSSMEFRTNKLYDTSDEDRARRVLDLKSRVSVMQAAWRESTVKVDAQAFDATDTRFADHRHFRLPFHLHTLDKAVPFARALCCAWLQRNLAGSIPIGDEQEQRLANAMFKQLDAQVHAEPPLDVATMRRFDKVAPRLPCAKMSYLGHAPVSKEQCLDPLAVWHVVEGVTKKGDGVYLAYLSGVDIRPRSARFGMNTAHYLAFRVNPRGVAFLDPMLGSYEFHDEHSLEFLDFFVAAFVPHVGLYQRVDLLRYDAVRSLVR